MTEIDLDALEALAEAATPGPWEAVGFYVRLGDGFAVALANSRQEHSPSDAAFIAAARTAVPALVARVRELEGKLLIATESGNVEAGEHAALRARLQSAERDRDDYRDKFSHEFALGMDANTDLVDAQVQLTALRDQISQLADEWEADATKYASMGHGDSDSHRQCRQISKTLNDCGSDLRAIIQSDTGGTNE